MLDRFTMRLSSDGVLTIVSSNSDVSKKCPKWFTCICNSFPSLVSLRDGGAMTPELFTSTSNRSYFASNALANARTDSKSAKSTSMTSTVAPGAAASTRVFARSPRASSRTAATTRRPAFAAAFAVSYPSPVFAPVITTTSSVARAARRRRASRQSCDVDLRTSRVVPSPARVARASRRAVAVAPSRAFPRARMPRRVASRRVAPCVARANLRRARDEKCASSRRDAMSPSLPTHRARDLAGAHDGAVLAVRFSRERRARA